MVHSLSSVEVLLRLYHHSGKAGVDLSHFKAVQSLLREGGTCFVFQKHSLYDKHAYCRLNLNKGKPL